MVKPKGNGPNRLSPEAGFRRGPSELALAYPAPTALASPHLLAEHELGRFAPRGFRRAPPVPQPAPSRGHANRASPTEVTTSPWNEKQYSTPGADTEDQGHPSTTRNAESRACHAHASSGPVLYTEATRGPEKREALASNGKPTSSPLPHRQTWANRASELPQSEDPDRSEIPGEWL